MALPSYLDRYLGPTSRGATAITIGTFDGVHRAHDELIRGARSHAESLGVASVVLTFRNHPREIVAPGRAPQLLMDWEAKERALLSLGVDEVIGLPFSTELSRVSAEEFVRDLLLKRLCAKAIFSGPNFHFGAGGRGNPALLHALGGELGFFYRCIEVFEIDGHKVSSSAIRAALHSGDVHLAARLLGRPHRLPGIVVEGDKLGRQIGFPTANLEISPSLCLPRDGVYAVEAILPNGAIHPAMMNIGFRPTVQGKTHRKEVHLLDFSGELVGQRLTVGFLQRLRDEERFDSLDALVAQLHRDRDQASAVWARSVVMEPSPARTLHATPNLN